MPTKGKLGKCVKGLEELGSGQFCWQWTHFITKKVVKTVKQFTSAFFCFLFFVLQNFCHQIQWFPKKDSPNLDYLNISRFLYMLQPGSQEYVKTFKRVAKLA